MQAAAIGDVLGTSHRNEGRRRSSSNQLSFFLQQMRAANPRCSKDTPSMSKYSSLRRESVAPSKFFKAPKNRSFSVFSEDTSVHSSNHDVRGLRRSLMGEVDRPAPSLLHAAADPNTYVCEKLLSAIGTAVISVAFNESGSLMAAGGANGQSDVYAVATGEHVGHFVASAGVNAALLLEHPQVSCVLCVGNFAGRIQLFADMSWVAGSWNPPTTSKPMSEFPFQGGAVHCMAASSDCQSIVAGGRLGEVIKYSVSWLAGKDGANATPILKPVLRVRTRSGAINALALSANGNVLATGGESKLVELWALGAGTTIGAATTTTTRRSCFAPSTALLIDKACVDRFMCDRQIHSIALSADASVLAVGVSTHTEVYRLKWSALQSEESFSMAMALGEGVRVAKEPTLFLEEAQAQQGGVALCAKGETLAVGGKLMVHLYHVPSGATLRRLQRDGRVRCVALTREGDVLATGGFDERVNMIRTEHGARLLHCPEASWAEVRSVHCVDGASLFAVGVDEAGNAGSVRLYDTNESCGEMYTTHLHTWEHSKPVWAVRFASDASLLFAAGYDGVATMYDPISKVALLRIVHHSPRGPAFIWSLSLSADMRTLAVGCWSGRAHIYRLNLARIRWRRAVEKLRASWGLPALSSPLTHSVDMLGLLKSARPPSRRPSRRPSIGSPKGSRESIGSREVSYRERLLSQLLGSFGGDNANTPTAPIIDSRLSSASAQAPPTPPANGKKRENTPPRGGAVKSKVKRTALLAEVGIIERTDRVYAVAISPSGSHLAVGGRDKRVALFSLSAISVHGDGDDQARAVHEASAILLSRERGAPEAPVLATQLACEWSSISDDFVYTVALSANVQYCAFGGPEMLAIVLDGRSGMRLWSIPCTGTVWSLAVFDASSSPKLVLGGDFSEVSVVDLASRTTDLTLPVKDVVHAVWITRSSIAYSSGIDAMIYGQSGLHFGWRDWPSFAYVTQTLATLTSNEQRDSFCQLLLHFHPAAINARSPSGGQALLQEVVRQGWADNNALLSHLIYGTNCRVGLQTDWRGQNPISVAIAHRKLNPLRVMFSAIASNGIRLSPSTMACISRSLDVLAKRHPSLFLDFLKTLPLEDEPEVLEDSSAADVILLSSAALGSEQRCPKGIWRDVLLEGQRRSAAGTASVTEALDTDPSVRSVSSDSSVRGDPSVHSIRSDPSVRGDPSVHSTRSDASVRGGQLNGQDPSVRGGQRSQADPSVRGGKGVQIDESVRGGQRSRAKGVQIDESVRGGQRSYHSSSRADQSFDAAKVPMGYPRVINSGVRAVRVPIENFAGHLVCDSGAHTTVLELVVHAVSQTRNYQIFATPSLSILIDFKWDRYARRSFLRQLLFFSLHLVWTTAFTLEASQRLDDSISPRNITWAEHAFFLLGWVQTTLVSLYYLHSCYRRIGDVGLTAYLQDMQDLINLLYNFFQVLVNVLFWLRDFTALFVFLPEDLDLTLPNLTDDPATTSLRIKESQDRGVQLGLYVTLQSCVMLALYMRVLFFFRGFRGFGSLMNMVTETTQAAAPFIVLILVVTLGFGLATHLLIQHTIFGQDPNYLHPMQTFNTIWNAGFRFIPPKPEAMRSRWQIIILYVVFMLFVQGILINLLVAMMAGTFARLRANAQLVAMFEHAKLILEIDNQAQGSISSFVGIKISRFWPLCFGRAKKHSALFPRWLHVLLPPEDMNINTHKHTEDSEGGVQAPAQRLNNTNAPPAYEKQKKLERETLKEVVKEALKEGILTEGLLSGLMSEGGNPSSSSFKKLETGAGTYVFAVPPERRGYVPQLYA